MVFLTIGIPTVVACLRSIGYPTGLIKLDERTVPHTNAGRGGQTDGRRLVYVKS